MPVHDWTRVDSGIFHDFHQAWLVELKKALNSGLLPPDLYALVEQVSGPTAVPDVLTLHDQNRPNGEPVSGGLMLADAPPAVRATERADASTYVNRGREVVVRHVSGDGIVAVI